MNVKEGWLVLAWIVTIVGITIIAVEYHDRQKPHEHPFSPHQHITSMQREYNECRAAAPEGFDCRMTAIMVSEEFLKEEYK